ncbi:MAG: ABC transporter permease [Saprospiraceae bacterium]|jgi:ABC-type polysaccharide/polyol phosphate export permease|nr:ABC transporter permease [Saprospiraceae bacterium]
MIPSFLKDINKQKVVLMTLVMRDFSSRYLTSYIGLPWAFIQPITHVFIMWFAFTYGLKAANTTSGIPFTAWLMVSLIPWMFISQSIIVCCLALPEYAFLIKKTKFNVLYIPLIKILSGMVVHGVMLVFIVLLLVFKFNISPSIYWLQIPYYMLATLLLLTGIGWIVSSINIFVHDMGHIVNIVVSILFWATPILWPFTTLTGNLRYLALLNPFFYITEGYRYTFIENVWFFEFAEMNLYFWAITLFLLFFGHRTFRKLQPEFGDIL